MQKSIQKIVRENRTGSKDNYRKITLIGKVEKCAAPLVSQKLNIYKEIPPLKPGDGINTRKTKKKTFTST